MSDNTSTGDAGHTEESAALRHETQDEVVQAVVDRVLSWHEGAEAGVVEEELRKGLAEAGASRDDAWVRETAERISGADPAQG